MARNGKEKRKEFYVVQFIESPFEGIAQYVCVPSSWLILYLPKIYKQKAVVAYPKDEDPIDTRVRVKRKEKIDDEWKYYMAMVKYESNNYKDAEHWAARENGDALYLEETLKKTDTQQRCTLNRSRSLKSNDDFRKPLPKTSTKRPSASEPKKQIDEKRIKKDEAGPSSNTVVENAYAKPGSSKRQQSIITQDPQQIIFHNKFAQTQGTGAAALTESRSSQCTDKNLQESLPKQKQDELNMPLLDNDMPTIVIDDDRKVQPTSIGEQQPSSNQGLSQFSEQPEPAVILVPPSMEMACNDQERTDDVLDTVPTSHQFLNSLKMSANLYSHMKKARLSKPIQPTIEKSTRPMYIKRRPSNLMDQTGSLSPSAITQGQSQDDQRVPKMHQTVPLRSIAVSPRDIQHVPKMNVERSNNVVGVDSINVFESVVNSASTSQNLSSSSNLCSSFVRQFDGQPKQPTREQYLTRSDLNQYLSTYENSFRPTESYNHQPNSPTIRMRTPSVEQNSSNSLHQISELPQQRQPEPNQAKKPKIHIRISVEPKNNKQLPNLRGVTKNVQRSDLTRILDAILQKLKAQNSYPQNEQQIGTSRSERASVIRSPVQGMSKSCQTDMCKVEESPPYQAVTSGSDAFTDNVDISSNYETPSDEAIAGTTNDVYCSGVTSERHTDSTTTANNTRSRQQYNTHNADSSTDARNSTYDRNHPRIVLEQQMLNDFDTLFSQMCSTLNYTRDMYNYLQDSIHECAETYRNTKFAFDKYNAEVNSASNETLRKMTPEVLQVTEERYTGVTARASSSSENQYRNDLTNKVATKQGSHNLRRVVLPPEYDPDDTRWTLRYRNNMPGLVELTPQSGIYVGYGELKYCEQVSKDCKSLAQRLLREVFTINALRVCYSMTEKAHASNYNGSDERPELDKHATTVLLKFVFKYGFQRGWNTDIQPIVSILHRQILKIRSKYN